MTAEEATAKDAPAHYRLAEAEAWASGFNSARDEIEKLRRERDDLLSYLKGISRQTAEMVKAHQ